jgi:hypothetical protein
VLATPVSGTCWADSTRFRWGRPVVLGLQHHLVYLSARLTVGMLSVNKRWHGPQAGSCSPKLGTRVPGVARNLGISRSLLLGPEPRITPGISHLFTPLPSFSAATLLYLLLTPSP